ncbi:MAG: hypothetical protein IKR25_06875 [Muribaculaceae bacterium]|nr:hypothetical protein [Muribaculaceae bacterium]
MITYLKEYREETPAWIENYLRGQRITFQDVMSSRVGYYPGCGFDGALIKVCNMAHCVHSFLYVDYLIEKHELEQHLAQPRSIHGYHAVGRIDWTESDLTPHGQYPFNVHKRPRMNPLAFVDRTAQPFCFTLIMERDEGRDDSWGAEHFAVTFLLADGIATYYQLFAREYGVAPWIFLLQDHGFGCNYDCFGRGGVLDAIIKRNNCRPPFVICGDNTRIWDGYEHIKQVEPVCGGMHHNPRSLFQLSSQTLNLS